jgi:hypothetical protein
MGTPLSFSNDQKQSATSSLNQGGASWGMGAGDWVVNVPTSGNGLALQGGASSGLSTWLMVGAGLAALYLLRRKK